MREVLFRGKEKSTGKWAYGNYYKAKYQTIIAWNKNDSLGNFGDRYHPVDNVVVDEETIGQFTGLHDKNGKKIFEDDIVKYTRTKVREPFASWNGQDLVSKHLIYWNEEKHCFYQNHYTQKTCIGSGSISFNDIRAEENIIEVIGNIHDNPELLEGK